MKLITPMQVRFSDVDRFGHINNAVYLTYIELARLRIFQDESRGASVESLSGEGAGIVIGYQEIAYRAPIGPNVQTVEVAAWVTRVGRSSFDIAYTVRDGEVECAIAATSIVLVDVSTGRPRTLPVPAKAVLEHFSGPPVNVRGR
ncbi:acyl-CoA thioesterase [Arthrobacter sp. B6]|uniref:acyl-CoA thioesterase n=1 Tax=Arthrobacter sp. B6 TaxID=1570137 RepID=UPI0009EDBD40|nr:thioesterase family protein [Arthrobacter sp. B6]